MMFVCLACSVAQLGGDIPGVSCLSACMVQYADYQETEGPVCVCVCVCVRERERERERSHCQVAYCCFLGQTVLYSDIMSSTFGC